MAGPRQMWGSGLPLSAESGAPGTTLTCPPPSCPGWVSLLGLGREKAWRNAGPSAGPPGLCCCPWLCVRAPQQACSRCGHVYGWRPCDGGRAHVFCESQGSPLSWALAALLPTDALTLLAGSRLAGDQGAVGGNAGWDRGRPRPQGSRPARPVGAPRRVTGPGRGLGGRLDRARRTGLCTERPLSLPWASLGLRGQKSRL